MAVGRISRATTLIVFSYKKMYGPFVVTGKSGCNNNVIVRRGFTVTGMFLTQQSPPMPRKNLAKMAAALYACEELHKIGELDDNLLPVCSLSDEDSELEEEEGESGEKKKTKAGTKKRQRRYGRKVRCRVSWGIISDCGRIILKCCFSFCSFGPVLLSLRRTGFTSR